MAFPKSKRKHLCVDGLEYTACINECGYTVEDAVKLSVAIRAEYGTKSLCIVEGMTNRDFWHDYPNYDPNAAIAITPRVVCEIIRYSLRNGWQPMQNKATLRVQLDNEGLTAMIAGLTRDPKVGGS
jgi:hypothetical protein